MALSPIQTRDMTASGEFRHAAKVRQALHTITILVVACSALSPSLSLFLLYTCLWIFVDM